MKREKRKGILSVLILCALCITPVHAESADMPQTVPVQDSEETENATPGEAEPEEPPVLLHIDSENLYKDMKKSYRQGYTPTVKDNKVVVVLPLEPEGKLFDDTITAGLDLGVTEGSPFVYKNYEKSFRLSEQKIGGKARGKDIFYVRFVLALSKERKNGTYPLIIMVSGKDHNKNPFSQSFTVYVTITDGEGEPEPAENGGGQPEKPTSSPIVLVSQAAISPEEPPAGSVFGAAVTIYNTSASKPVQNMVVRVECENEYFTLKEDSDSIYISELGTVESKEIPLHFAVNRNTPDGAYKIRLALSYEDPEAATYTSEGSITVSVKQNLQVALTLPSLPQNVHAGDTIPLDFQVMNLGRSKIYNARCNVEGDGLVATKVAFIGNLEAGTEDTATMNLYIGMKSEEGSDSEKYGDTKGRITLIYEDAGGKEYREDFDISTKIEKPVIASDRGKNVQEKPKKQWWGFVSLLAIAGLTGGVVYAVRRKRG